MLNLSIKEAKANFFRPEKITDPVERQVQNVLFKQANLVKKISQRSMRPARQRGLAELSAKELRIYKLELARFKAGQRKSKPVRGFVASKAGEPPRTRGRRLLRKEFYAVRDPATKTVVTGPVRLNGRGFGTAPRTLEYGGTAEIGRRQVKIAPRPFIAPAVKIASPQFAAMWRGNK